MGKMKISLKEVKENFIKRGYIPLFDIYTNNNTKLPAINSDGYKIVISLAKLRSGRNPHPFGVHNPYTVENIKQWLINNSKSVELLSDKYINAHSHLMWNCYIHDYTYSASWSDILQGKGCRFCGIDSVKNKLKYSLGDIKVELQKISPSIRILSDEYINNTSKLWCVCLVSGCNHKWYTSWASLKTGKGCPACKAMNCDGIFGTALAERHKISWLNKNAIVYTIQCSNNEELFYKIGITTHTTQKRFAMSGAMPYSYQVIDEVYTNLYDAVYLEQKLHKILKKYSYIPKIKFGGWTECFSTIE